MREIGEELGLMIEPDDLEPLSFASGQQPGVSACGELVILLYSCRRWRGVPVCRGGEEIAWQHPEDLARLDMPPLDYPLAASLVASCS